MALKLSVKIGDVTNLSDARYAAGMGVDYIGFNINPDSEHFVTPETYNEITNWISGVGIIGEVGNSYPENSDEYVSFLPETHNQELAHRLDSYVLRLNVDVFSIDEIRAALDNASGAEFYILEASAKWLNEHTMEMKALCNSNTIYISSEFDPDILDTIVNTIKPQGIEIKGSLEDQPGFKDYDGIADVLEWLEID